MKPTEVKIISISTSYEPKILGTVVYGLGDDGTVYWWSTIQQDWYAYEK